MKNVKCKSIQDQQTEYTKTKEVLDLFNAFCENNKMPESKIYRNLIEEETSKLINQFNKSELFEVVYFSTLEGLYNTENYYVCYNPEERRLESFNSLECLKQVEEFKTPLNLIKEVLNMNNKIYVYAFIGKIVLNIVCYSALVLLVLSVAEYCLRG